MAKFIYMSDLAAASVDDLCGRRYWYREMEGGRGIMRKEHVIPEQILAATLHDLHTLQSIPEGDLEVLALNTYIEDMEQTLTSADREDVTLMRLFYRRLGWLAAWAIYHEGITRHVYETVPLPEEITFVRDPLKVKVRVGRLLRARGSKEVVYRTFEPTPVVTQRWKGSIGYSIRPYIEAQAVMDETGIGIDHIQVQGLLTGHQVGDSISHPYVTVYRNPDTLEWSHNFLYGKSGEWEEKHLWDYPGGVMAWVLKCGLDVANAQFTLGPPLTPMHKMVEAWVARRLHRERQILGAASDSHTNYHLRNQHFPMNTTACSPLFEEKCPYTNLCWCQGTILNPLANGPYVPRPPLMVTTPEVLEGVVVA